MDNSICLDSESMYFLCHKQELTHSFAEEGKRVVALDIAPISIFAPIVENEAILIVGIRRAWLTFVPTSERETLIKLGVNGKS